MKTKTLLLLAAILATPVARAAETRTDPRTVDRVAAIVNGEVITLSELIERAGNEYRRAWNLPPGPTRDQARAKVLRAAYEAVLAERLIEGEVKTAGIDVTEAQIDAAIEDVKKRNNLSDDMLKQALAGEGLSVTAYRARLRKDFENHLVVSTKVQSRVKISDDDVKGYYQSHLAEFTGEEQVKLRLILLQVAAGAPAEQEARVKATGETLLTRIAAGEDFADLAKQVSQGPGASSGGDLGWVKKGTMPIDLERVAFTLEPGQNSGLVRAKTGWIILKADDRRAGKAPPLDEVKERIREKIGMQQLEMYRKQYIDELRRDAVIELKIPELEAATPG